MLAGFRGVDTVNLPLVGATSLWHAAFIVVGCVTLLLAMLTTTMREPPRLASTEKGGRGRVAVLRRIYAALGRVRAGDGRLYLPRHPARSAGSPGCRAISSASSICRRSQAGIQVGWTTTIAGVSGAVVGGYIADWMMRRGVRGGKVLDAHHHVLLLDSLRARHLAVEQH